MFTLDIFILKIIIAGFLGMLIGLERDLSGKEAGLRTEMLVTTGACIFTIISLYLPYYFSNNNLNLFNEIVARNSGFLNLISNIIVGIGFLGAGIIIKQEHHVYGLTTAALIWFSAGIGILVGLDLYVPAFLATLFALIVLYILRKINYLDFIKKYQKENKQKEE